MAIPLYLPIAYGHFCATTAEVCSFNRVPTAPQSLKHLLSGPSQINLRDKTWRPTSQTLCSEGTVLFFCSNFQSVMD